MELRQLRYFVTLAEELHFRRAAERMHIAQPAFSEQIRRLEAELGARLFDRTSHYVHLTQAGRLFLDEVRPALAQVDHAAAVARRAGRGVLGTITVGFIGAGAGELTPRILRRFAERHPAVSVEVHEFGFADPSAGLLDRRTDVAFVRPPVPGAERLVLTPLFEEPRVAILPADHPLAGAAALTAGELLGEVFVRGPADTAGLDDDCLGTTGRAGTTEEWLAMIAMGAGVGLAPASAERFHHRAGLAFVPIADLAPSVLAVAHSAEGQTPAVIAFVDVARAVAAEAARGDRAAVSRETELAIERTGERLERSATTVSEALA